MVVTDWTPTFQQVVSHLESSSPELRIPVRDKKRILKSSKKEELTSSGLKFEKHAKEILTNIEELRTFLVSNRSAYLDNLHQGIVDHVVSDDQRDKIDAGANIFIRTCNGLIAQFKEELSSAKDSLNPTLIRHFDAVCEILQTFLKSVCQIHSEQKAIRVQQEIEFQKLSRLEVKARSYSESEEALEDRAKLLESRRMSDEALEEMLKEPEDMDADEDLCLPRMMPSSSSARAEKMNAHNNPALIEEQATDMDLDPEEMQKLEQENEKMYEDFVKVQDSFQHIESKVVKIAELQEIFTEKVLQQKGEIDLISLNAVATTENVTDANEELRKAIQNQASVRVYILFFLLVMSFSLLFLDWYND